MIKDVGIVCLQLPFSTGGKVTDRPFDYLSASDDEFIYGMGDDWLSAVGEPEPHETGRPWGDEDFDVRHDAVREFERGCLRRRHRCSGRHRDVENLYPIRHGSMLWRTVRPEVMYRSRRPPPVGR